MRLLSFAIAVICLAVGNAYPAEKVFYYHTDPGLADSQQYQDLSHSHMHAMRMPGQSAEEAAGLTVTFVNQQVAEYKKLMAAGQEGKAYEALGMAMHPLMDATSPSHEGYQEWGGIFPIIPNALNAVSHERAEDEKIFHANPDYSARSVGSIRSLYDEAVR